MDVRVKRVYDDPVKADGHRVLVDRLWPRGIRKDDLDHDEWCKEVAPSDDLRKAFHGGEVDFAEFARRYRSELRSGDQHAALAHLRELAAEHGTLTLLVAAKDVDHNQARVLAEELGA